MLGVLLVCGIVAAAGSDDRGDPTGDIKGAAALAPPTGATRTASAAAQPETAATTTPPPATTPPASAPPASTTTPPAARTPAATKTTGPAKAPTTKATTRPAGNCNPNYSPCVPNDPVDVDCAGGGGNGPSYVQGPVRVIGTDVYRLDRDGDGIACE